jgi:hypothetical protein
MYLYPSGCALESVPPLYRHLLLSHIDGKVVVDYFITAVLNTKLCACVLRVGEEDSGRVRYTPFLSSSYAMYYQDRIVWYQYTHRIGFHRTFTKDRVEEKGATAAASRLTVVLAVRLCVSQREPPAHLLYLGLLEDLPAGRRRAGEGRARVAWAHWRTIITTRAAEWVH